MTVRPASATPPDAGAADDDGGPESAVGVPAGTGQADADPPPRAVDASPTPANRRGDRLAGAARAAMVCGWLLIWATAVAAAATAVVDIDLAADLPDWVAPTGAGVVTVLHAVVLAHRVGYRTWLWTGLVAAGTGAGLLADTAWALASVSVLSAVVSGVAAVLVTRPAATAWRCLVEFVVALLVAAAGAVAVAGIDADVRPDRYSLVVAAVALALAIALIWQLGAGLHGLGRRGLVVIAGAAVLVTGLLAYTHVVREYGSPEVVDRIDDAVAWMRDTLHGVPRPVQALIGFPALVWGIGTRSVRRQGWWLCAFGVLGTATLAASLATAQPDVELVAVSAGYSAAIGAVLGLAVRGVDRRMTRRARTRRDRRAPGTHAVRLDEAPLVRPEPPRTRPLD